VECRTTLGIRYDPDHGVYLECPHRECGAAYGLRALPRLLRGPADQIGRALADAGRDLLRMAREGDGDD